jgi:3-hydroxyacyl-CoA dehydrogenase
MESRKAAIVGAGLIGRAWAMIFARAGWQVALHDPVPAALEAAPRLCAEGLANLAAHGLCEDAPAATARIRVAEGLADALSGAELVQENGPERPDAKIAIFAELDRLAERDAIIASSTSAIPASVFTEALAGRARCLVAHPVNPPHLVPVVELCGAPWTAPETLERARAIYAGIGQVPVTVRREVDGFILNRLQGALLAEAFRLVSDGYVSPQDLDHTVKNGLGLRWSFMGPFETIELNAPGGIADYVARFGPSFLAPVAASAAGPEVFGPEAVARILAEWGVAPAPARIAERSAWRDARLAALVAHKREQAP